jgi:hypothetical protein
VKRFVGDNVSCIMSSGTFSFLHRLYRLSWFKHTRPADDYPSQIVIFPDSSAGAWISLLLVHLESSRFLPF